LFELLIAVFIASIIFMALFMMMSSGRANWHRTDTQIALQQELRKAMRQITEDLRQSGISRVSVPADSANYSNISFAVAEGATTGAIIWSPNEIDYSLSGGQIIRTYNTDMRVIANNITSMVFRRFPATYTIVRINLTSQKRSVTGQLINASVGSAVTLRND
jgi:hypothetical protein